MRLSEYASTRKTRGSYKMPRSVQQSIPIDRIYADGVWQSENVFSLMWQISDINYAMQSDAAKQNILTQLGTVYAGIPADCWMQVCIVSQRMDEKAFARDVLYHRENDGFDALRAERNRQIKANARENGNVVQHKYIIVSTNKPGVKEARERFVQVQGHATMKNKSFTKMVVGYDISAYTAMKCFSGAAVTRKTAEVVSNILGVSVRDAFRFERDERPLSKKTIREYVLFANQVLHFANERYHSVQAEFKMPAKGARPRFVDCIHEDEVCKLMSEIDKCSMPEQAIVLSLLNTGVRRAELAGLTWSDFDFKECTVHVNKSLLVFRDFGYQHTATKESNDRYIDVAPEYMEFMQQYKEWWYTKKRLMGASWQRDMVKNKESKRESLMRLAGEEFVIIDDFGWPRNPDGYNALVKRVAKKAGLKDIHPHMFRHTFVSLLMSNPDIGVATVAAEAGHAQPSTTLMIYTQQYKKRRESIRNQLSRELYEK